MNELFLKLLNMGIATSWLILAVIAMRFVFRRAPKTIRVVLWSLVGLRLVWPFSWESILSMVPSRETISPNVLKDAIPSIHSGTPIVNQAVNPLLSESMALTEGVSVNPIQVITSVATVVWLAGVATLLLSGVISTVRLRRCVADAVRLRDNLWQCERIASPFVFGLFRPRVYLPLDLDSASLTSVVRHEQAHIFRHDHWIKPAGYLLLTVYWFNPLVWLAYHLLSRDIELACDERVVKTMGSADKKAYSEALLACSVPRRQVTACPLAFGEVGVKERIKNVLRVKKPAFWLIMAAILACILLAVCFLTDPRQEDADSPMTIAVTEGVYAYKTCVWMSSLSSHLPGLDSGYLYEIEDDCFRIISSSSGEVHEQITGIRWDFAPFTDADWDTRFITPPVPDVSVYREKYSLDLSERIQLLSMDGELWLAHRTNGDKFWSIESLVLQKENFLTLQKMLILAGYGEHLAWEHLRPYAHSDIGSGRYIHAFPIDEHWRFTVNSGSGFTYGEKVPGSALLTLEYLPDQTGVDVRQQDPAVFAAQKESVRTGLPVVFSGTSLCAMSPANTQAALNEIRYDPDHGKTYLVPFSVYVDGSEIYGGRYTITDVESKEALTFFTPSGLPSQMYLLRETKPGHRYVITFKADDAIYAFILVR